MYLRDLPHYSDHSNRWLCPRYIYISNSETVPQQPVCGLLAGMSCICGWSACARCLNYIRIRKCLSETRHDQRAAQCSLLFKGTVMNASVDDFVKNRGNMWFILFVVVAGMSAQQLLQQYIKLIIYELVYKVIFAALISLFSFLLSFLGINASQPLFL